MLALPGIGCTLWSPVTLPVAREPACPRAHVTVCLLKEYESQALSTGVGAQACGLCNVEERESRCCDSDCFALSKAQSCSAAQRKLVFVPRRGRRGARSGATVSVLTVSWFTNPKKEWRSDGEENLDIASVMELSNL